MEQHKFWQAGVAFRQRYAGRPRRSAEPMRFAGCPRNGPESPACASRKASALSCKVRLVGCRVWQGCCGFLLRWAHLRKVQTLTVRVKGTGMSPLLCCTYRRCAPYGLTTKYGAGRGELMVFLSIISPASLSAPREPPPFAAVHRMMQSPCNRLPKPPQRAKGQGYGFRCPRSAGRKVVLPG